MQVNMVGIDLAKNVFCVHGCDANGKAVVRKQLSQRQLLSFVANLPRCLVAMEACASHSLYSSFPCFRRAADWDGATRVRRSDAILEP